MSAPVQVMIAFLGLIVSAQTRVTIPILGVVPVLGLVAVAVVLALAAAALVLVRSLLHDGLRLRPLAVAP